MTEIPFNKKLFLKIKPAENRESFVNDMYRNHSSAYEGDSGIDVFCPDSLEIPAKAISFCIPLGIKCAMSDGVAYGGTVTLTSNHSATGFILAPRSSMGKKTPLIMGGSFGLIDEGYRGEITAYVHNVSDSPFKINIGDSYFQLFHPSLREIKVMVVENLPPSQRGEKGFGSSNNRNSTEYSIFASRK